MTLSRWNYRIVCKDGYYGVHEVYYARDGKPCSTSEEAVTPVAESVDELRERLNQVLESFAEPVLEYSEIGTEEKQQ